MENNDLFVLDHINNILFGTGREEIVLWKFVYVDVPAGPRKPEYTYTCIWHILPPNFAQIGFCSTFFSKYTIPFQIFAPFLQWNLFKILLLQVAFHTLYKQFLMSNLCTSKLIYTFDHYV